MTGSQFRLEWSSWRHFRLDNTLLAWPNPSSTINNQQSTISINTNYNTNERRFAWGSISIYYLKNPIPVRLLVLILASIINDHFSDCYDLNWISRPGRCPTIQNKTISQVFHISLGFDNQTRSYWRPGRSRILQNKTISQALFQNHIER